jgi:hypothetical protein
MVLILHVIVGEPAQPILAHCLVAGADVCCVALSSNCIVKVRFVTPYVSERYFCFSHRTQRDQKLEACAKA